MSEEVVGTIEVVEPKDKGGSKLTLRTDDGQTRTLHIPSNYEGPKPDQGARGKANFREWTPPGGQYAMKMMDGWEALGAAPVSPNGAESPKAPETPSQGRSDSKDAAFVLSYAKDLVKDLIIAKGITDPNEIQGAWLSLADAGIAWIRQNS